LVKAVDGLVMDESTEVANKRTLPFRICRQITKQSQFVFSLTGTPFGRDPMPIWGQMFLVDKGHTLGESMALFRSAFYTEKKNYWGGFEYTFRDRRRKLLHRFLADRSIRYPANKADLPRLVSIVKELRLAADAREYYERARETLAKARGNFREMKNAFMSLRQISSGFLGFKDDETGEKARFEFTPNVKLDALIDLVTHIRRDRKIVVFHDFIFSGELISRALTRLGIDHARVYGKTRDTREQLLRFKTDPKCRVFLVNSAAGWAGLNLQVAKYLIYYESPVGVIMRTQTQRRVERQESEHEKVFVYDLVVRGTVDQRILDFHKSGKDLFRAVIDGEMVL